jgi:hypothetical protein
MSRAGAREGYALTGPAPVHATANAVAAGEVAANVARLGHATSLRRTSGSAASRPTRLPQ